MTYGELREQTAGLRGAFQRLGIGEGDRVALLCGNDPYFVVALLATVGLGAAAVPLNPTSPAPELERQLSEVTPSAAVVGPMASQAWQADPSVGDRSRSRRSWRPRVTTWMAPTPSTSSLTGEPAPTVESGGRRSRAPDVHERHGRLRSAAAMLSHGNLAGQPGPDPGHRARSPEPRRRGVRRAPAEPHHGPDRRARCSRCRSGASVVLVQRFDPGHRAGHGRAIAASPWSPARRRCGWPGPSSRPTTWPPLRQVRIATTGAARLPEHVAVDDAGALRPACCARATA